MPTRIFPEELVELDRPFEEFWRTLAGPWPFRPWMALMPGKQFIPAADMFARNGDMVVRVDLPGVDPKDIHVKFEDGELTIKGERKADKEVKEEGYYRKESIYGLFERHMTLPKNIKESEIKAEYDNGVLEVIVPKVKTPEELPKVKEIPVKALKPAVKV